MIKKCAMNLLLHRKYTNCDSILTLFARISKPLWLNMRSTGAEVAGKQFHASWVTKTESSWSQVPRPSSRLFVFGQKKMPTSTDKEKQCMDNILIYL